MRLISAVLSRRCCRREDTVASGLLHKLCTRVQLGGKTKGFKGIVPVCKKQHLNLLYSNRNTVTVVPSQR